MPYVFCPPDIELLADFVQQLFLANFDDLTVAIDGCCAEGLVAACCMVAVSETITTGPINGTVLINETITTTTTTSTTTTTLPTPTTQPVLAPTRGSFIAAIWGGVSVAILFVILLIVFMVLATGGFRQ